MLTLCLLYIRYRSCVLSFLPLSNHRTPFFKCSSRKSLTRNEIVYYICLLSVVYYHYYHCPITGLHFLSAPLENHSRVMKFQTQISQIYMLQFFQTWTRLKAYFKTVWWWKNWVGYLSLTRCYSNSKFLGKFIVFFFWKKWNQILYGCNFKHCFTVLWKRKYNFVL